MKTNLLTGIIALMLIAQCAPKKTSETPDMSITSKSFGTLPGGEEATLYTLTNAKGVEMQVTNYGGIITSLKVADKDGNFEDIVLGYDKLDAYVEANPYFGAIIGRFGNRIAKGTFALDSQEYKLVQNNGPNHLHGGTYGFDKVIWNTKEIKKDDAIGLEFTRTSPDMEEGYPGNLDVKVIYLLDNDNNLTFDYEAVTDKKTIVNLTQHTYFNLSAMKDDILGHELMINASKFLPVDSTLIPTGEYRPVDGTPFDFTTPKVIGKDIEAENQQLEYGKGFDHCWILNEGDKELSLAATLYEPNSGRYLEVLTTEPGIQFYSGNFLDGSNIGKSGVPYNFRTGLCLETQHYPDSPNQSKFPSVVLSPGETYKTTTVVKFSTK